MNTTKSTLAGLPLGVWAHTERLSHRGPRSTLRGKPKWPNLRLRYRSSGDCRFKLKDGPDDPLAVGGRNGEANFHGERRSNETHTSTTDPDARLYRKGSGKEAKLFFIAYGLLENRLGLLVDACLNAVDGHAERMAALHMISTCTVQCCRDGIQLQGALSNEDIENPACSCRLGRGLGIRHCRGIGAGRPYR